MSHRRIKFVAVLLLFIASESNALSDQEAQNNQTSKHVTVPLNLGPVRIRALSEDDQKMFHHAKALRVGDIVALKNSSKAYKIIKVSYRRKNPIDVLSRESSETEFINGLTHPADWVLMGFPNNNLFQILLREATRTHDLQASYVLKCLAASKL